MAKKTQNIEFIQLLKLNAGKMFVVGFFALVVTIFSIFFLRKDHYVEVRLFLTERQEVKYWQNFPDPYYLQNLEVGSVEKDELGTPIAEVVDVFRVNTPYQQEQALVTLRLKANYSKTAEVYSFQGQPLIVGDYQRIKIGSLRLQGYLLAIDEHIAPFKEKEYVVNAIFDDVNESTRGGLDSRVTGALSEVVSSVTVGQVILDSHNNAILEVQAIDSSPAVRQYFTNQGRQTVFDTSLVQGEVTLMLRTIELDGVDYWNFINPIQVGQRLNINFNQTVLPVRITEIKSAQDV